jgi:hypothetical protein
MAPHGPDAWERLNPRRFAVLAMGIVMLVGVVLIARGSDRRFIADFIGVRFKNQILALYTLATSPSLQTDDLAPIAFANLEPYAVNTFLDQEVQTENVARSLDLIRDAGFRFIKQELVWNDVERPQKGSFEDNATAGKSSWMKYDRIVDLAEQRGIEVIFRIDTTPDWARPGSAKHETPPDRFEDYGDFVAAVVARYRGRVHYYQIWNEPNWAFEWGDRVAQPAEYVGLLRVAYERAKSTDPSVVILSASLAPTIENSERAITDVSFLQQMYESGAQPFFDVLSANAYGLRNGPDDFRFNRLDDVNFSRPVLLREIMVQNGDRAKPIWASEIGWDALPANWSQLPLLFGSVSRELQAEYTVRAYQRAAEQWPWMGVMAVWHFRKVQPEDAQQQDYYFDLVSTDWKPEKIYDALKSLTALPPIVHRGYRAQNYWALQWSADWQQVAERRAAFGITRVATSPDSTLSFDLDGTWLDLVTPSGPTWGRLGVIIDGNPYAANRLPIVNNLAQLSLTSADEQWQVRRPIADGLSPGIHHVVVQVLDGRAGIEAIVADRESPRDVLFWRVAWFLIGVGTLVAASRWGTSSVVCDEKS